MYPRQRRPREVSGQDEASLSWFFGQGLSIYEKSTFGPIVEKIQLDGYASTTCGKCDGAGIIEEGGGITLDDRCQGCSGSGLAPRKKGDSQQWCLTCDGLGRVQPYVVEMAKGGWCPSCRGTGSGCIERRAMKRAPCSGCGSAATKDRLRARAQCGVCLGSGQEPLTAKPVLKGDEGGGVLGNDVALTRFAITSRRVGLVKAISPALHAALEAFYGDVGNRWARSPFGRMFALSHLTPAGKKLARLGTGNPERKGKSKKKKAKTEQLLAAALTRSARSEADRLAQQLADERRAPPKPRDDDELAVVELNVQERIGVQANLQKSQPQDNRRELLAKAQEQAEDLYSRAARAWNQVATSKSDIAANKRLDENLRRLGHAGVAKAVRMLSGGAP